MSTQFDFKNLKGLIKRRKRIFLYTFLLIFFSAFALALFLPPIYRSEAMILIQNQQIPEEYVKDMFTSYIEEHLAKLTRQIMTRAKLMKIIEEFDLFKENPHYQTKQDFVEQISESVKVEPVYTQVLNQRTGRTTGVTTSFKLIYEAKDPFTAQKVTNILAKLYLEEHDHVKSKRTSVTIEFFLEELEKLENQIKLYEKQISEFKALHTDELPQHQGMILQTTQRLDRELESLDFRILNLQDSIIFLQGQLADVDPLKPIMTEDGKMASNPRERLRDLELQLIRRQATLSPKHPDIKKLKREIKELEDQVGKSDNSIAKIKRLDELRVQLSEQKGRLGSKHPDVIKLSKEAKSLSSEIDTLLKEESIAEFAEEKPDNPAYISLITRITSAQMTLDTYRHEREEIKQEIEKYQKKMEIAPFVESEYNDLARDYKTVNAKYHQILEKLLEARMTQSLEKKSPSREQTGEHFTILNHAYFPQKPYKPNRLRILLMGFICATGAGLGIAAARESMDNSIKTPEEIHDILGVPVFSTISLVVTDQENRRRNYRNLIAILSAIVVIVSTSFLVNRFVTPLDIVWTKFQDRLAMMGIPISPPSLDEKKISQPQKPQ